MSSLITKHILVIYTGGTIGMTKNESGAYCPLKNKLMEWVKDNPDMHDESLARKYCEENNIFAISHKNTVILYTMVEYNPLLDSSNISPMEWKKIADDIGNNYSKYDGFVVLHGTDTLHYTASMLSFMLENLDKSVIVTGSQIPIFEQGSDGKDNFFSSLIFAANDKISEVCVCFGNVLLRGNRTIKYSNKDLHAFQSPNYNLLGECRCGFILYEDNLLKPASGKIFNVNSTFDAIVSDFEFNPFKTPEMLKSAILPDAKGLILITYGLGNIPTSAKIIDILKEAVNSGIIIVNITECIHGTVNFSRETGKVCEDIGILSGYDMTKAAAIAKLKYVLSMKDLSLEEKKTMMMKVLRGEMTKTYA